MLIIIDKLVKILKIPAFKFFPSFYKIVLQDSKARFEVGKMIPSDLLFARVSSLYLTSRLCVIDFIFLLSKDFINGYQIFYLHLKVHVY